MTPSDEQRIERACKLAFGLAVGSGLALVVLAAVLHGVFGS